MNRNQALECIVRQVCQGELVFPTNMAASVRLQHALGDPDCHLDTAADMVLAEPLIAARLVAIANSVAYTRFGGHVSNVRTAVSLLGFKPLRSLVAVIVVRQLASQIVDAKLRHKADLLWQHCASVAALAKVLAREFTGVDPETTLFAGIVHEIDGFYLLSRAAEFPALLEEGADTADYEVRAVLSGCILKALKIPVPVAAAVASLYTGVSIKPPVSVGDILVLANGLATTSSPLIGATVVAPTADPDFSVGDKTLQEVLKASADEVKALTDALLI
jgi:HD-like signal output (HDOD) protein